MTPDLLPTGSASDTSGAMRAMTQDGARLPSGPGPHWVDMRVVCQILAARARPRAEQQRVTIELLLGSEKAIVIGFAPLLLTALEHLASRSLESMPHGGQLTLRVFRDPYVVIECCDTGAGSIDHMTRSWRSADLQRADTETALAAAKQIIQAHRGYLWQRPSGNGNCVIVELPAAGPSEPYKPWRGKSR